MSIAVIGSGTTGLYTAYYLAKKGYKNIDIYEKDDHIGGRLKSSISEDIDHCERINPNIYFNGNSVYKDIGIWNNIQQVEGRNMANTIKNGWIKLIQLICTLLLPWTTFEHSISIVLNSEDLALFQNFILNYIYINNFKYMSKLQGVVSFILFIFKKYVVFYSITNLSLFSLLNPFKKYLSNKGCQFITNTSVNNILKINNQYLINQKMYEYIFIASDLQNLTDINNVGLDDNYIDVHLDNKLFNAPIIYHLKLNQKLNNNPSPQSWIDMKYKYSILYKPSLNYIFLSIGKQVDDSEDPIAMINKYVSLKNEDVRSIIKKNNTEINNQVYIGPRINQSRIEKYLHPNIFIAGTYTDQYIFESSEAAALSSKYAVYNFVYRNKLWFKIMSNFQLLKYIYDLLMTLNII
jgi:hypothetical protein